MSWLHEHSRELLERIDEAKAERVYPFFRPFENLGPRVKVGAGSYINFTSNDYLGLSQHRDTIRRAQRALGRYGTGLGSARPQATSDRHDELERRLARWLGFGDCACFTTGYQGMVGVLTAFSDDDTCIAIDKLSHASILDGANMAQGMYPDLELRYFKHNSARSLDRLLASSDQPKKLVVCEGLYSVDGDVAPLADLIEVCRKHDAAIVVDDAHGIGSLGATGRGSGELCGVLGEIDFLFGSLSKSFGGIGGFVLAEPRLIEFLKLQARTFVYSASLPVAQIEAAIAALDIIENQHDDLLGRLRRNRDCMRRGLLSLGFDLGGSQTHITPIMVGDEVKTLTFGAYLFHGAGVIMMPFVYPGVPLGKARLRCNVTAAHDESTIGYTLEALASIGRELELLPPQASTHESDWSRARWLAAHELRSARNAGVGYVKRRALEAGRQLGQRLVGGTSSPKPANGSPSDEVSP